MPPPSLPDLARDRLSPEARRALDRLLRLSDRRQLRLYLVGGSVRDLLLGRRQLDLDLALEGDAIGLARALADQMGGQVVAHSRFGTATVRGQGFTLDLAMTRSETYARPGALPAVRLASLLEDLARRDFTVNAMALCLSGRDRGSLVDPHGGRDDLRRGLLRVLHERSFQDDATRILRALRYAGRLRLRLDPTTEALLRRDLSYLDFIGGVRIRRELGLILREERAAEVLAACAEAGALAAIHPSLAADGRRLAAVGELVQDPALAPREEAMLCLLAWGADEPSLAALASRLGLAGRARVALLESARLREEAGALGRSDLLPSEVAGLLARFPPATVWALALAAEGAARERALRYLREWRTVRPRLDGRALRALGVPDGPQMGALLESLRLARLDGRTASREDEVALALSLAGGGGGRHAAGRRGGCR